MDRVSIYMDRVSIYMDRVSIYGPGVPYIWTGCDNAKDTLESDEYDFRYDLGFSKPSALMKSSDYDKIIALACLNDVSGLKHCVKSKTFIESFIRLSCQERQSWISCAQDCSRILP